MKLVRLKITDEQGFRSLQPGFEHHFRTEWALQDEFSAQPRFASKGFAPFVCAGPNGSGKSNLLEALAAIFYHLECLVLTTTPDSFAYDEENNPEGFRSDRSLPDGFELEYLIKTQELDPNGAYGDYTHIKITKKPNEAPTWFQVSTSGDGHDIPPTKNKALLLPDFILGYSSGENELLSLPFFKMRFLQFDEYWHALKGQFDYSGRPEARMAYIDSSFSQAVLLCNLLYNDANALKLFEQDMGLGTLQEFRIIIKRTIDITAEQADAFIDHHNDQKHPALIIDAEMNRFTLNIVKLLEHTTYDQTTRPTAIINRLQRCATLYFEDEARDTLYLDYCVNDATRQAFDVNFGFRSNQSPIELFQAFQVLLGLNLYTVSDHLKRELYRSTSHYVTENVPTLANEDRILRFDGVKFVKTGVSTPVMLKDLSDGEHQLLHSLGLCLLFKDTQSLFLLDEPETHFNPAWRSSFISRLRDCFASSDESSPNHEMIITTHTPFLISDSEPHKVLVFNKDRATNKISVTHPNYNTLGASINKITIETFNQRETIGDYAYSLLQSFKERYESGELDAKQLIHQIDQRLGDSVEKMLLIKTIFSNDEGKR